MIRLADSERAAYCELAGSLGPDAATLCEGWDAYDLTAHLWAREARPASSVGLMVPGFGWHQKAIAQAKARFSFDELVSRVHTRRDVALPFRSASADEALNCLEFFVHHEDLRRGGQQLGPRVLSPVIDDLLWSRVPAAAAIAARRLKKAQPGMVVKRMRHGFLTDEAWVLTTGADPAVLVAEPGEAILWLFGRGDHAHLEWEGPEQSIREVQRVKTGI